MPMEIIIAVVVLVVIALAVIMFTTGGITKSGKSTQDTQDVGNSGIACQAQATRYCGQNPGATVCVKTSDCDKCDADIPCSRTGCGNGVCDTGESKTTCPMDCSSSSTPAPPAV